MTPSVQGIWNPFLNRPTHLNGKTFPIEEQSKFIPELDSATKQLLDMIKQNNLTDMDELNKRDTQKQE